MTTMNDNLSSRDMVYCDQLISAHPGITFSGSRNSPYHVVNLFADSASRLPKDYFSRTTTAEESVLSKGNFERFSNQHGVIVKHYHVLLLIPSFGDSNVLQEIKYKAFVVFRHTTRIQWQRIWIAALPTWRAHQWWRFVLTGVTSLSWKILTCRTIGHSLFTITLRFWENYPYEDRM